MPVDALELSAARQTLSSVAAGCSARRHRLLGGRGGGISGRQALAALVATTLERKSTGA
jgi:hypothetical protein